MTALRTPTGPKGSWLAGNLPDFRKHRLDFLTQCVRDHGDMVKLRFAHRSIYLTSHPDLIEDVLVTHSKHFTKHFALRLNPVILGNGLLTSEGDFWLRQRRLIQPVFSRTRIAGYGPAMVEITQRLIANWKPGEQRDIHVEMMRVTLDIAAKTLFGAEVGDQAHAIAEALEVAQGNFLERFNSLLPLPMWVPTPANLRMRRAVKRLNDVIYSIIQQRRQNPADRGDLLSLLLQARDEDDGTGMNDKQLRDEAMTLFLAGHETTALTLSWAWYLLANHPEAEAKLASELDAVLGGRAPTVDDWPKLKFTEMVALESMRLYPPAYVIGREALIDLDIGGYHVPKGTTVLMPAWVVHRDARWYDEPERFRPERWGKERVKSMPKFAYFPFGGGPRVCIGQQFAMMELILILATIGQRFRFRMQAGRTVTPLAFFTLRPATGIPGVIETR
ncbi:MAG TPA: cytochrome P450 [Gemmataceae bacterium]|nr:cytochrome P450 [Gemmataceae bacterium]